MIHMKPLIFSLVCLSLLASCTKDRTPEPDDPSRIMVSFSNAVNASSLHLDTMIYINAAGNHYKVTDLQYFISDMILQGKGGKVRILSDEGIHYIDARIPSTLSWLPVDTVPEGGYDSVSFVFGIDSLKNISNRFPNPPERDMAWPDILGGGYHYMKLNMMWSDGTANPMPFMFHLGIGQLYSGVTPDPDSITDYVQNWFRVTLPAVFTVVKGQKTEIILEMDLNQWFGAAEVFDFAQYPMMIMQNQEGMSKACRNGQRAFRIVVK